jgi:hypothetical protein
VHEELGVVGVEVVTGGEDGIDPVALSMSHHGSGHRSSGGRVPEPQSPITSRASESRSPKVVVVVDGAVVAAAMVDDVVVAITEVVVEASLVVVPASPPQPVRTRAVAAANIRVRVRQLTVPRVRVTVTVEGAWAVSVTGYPAAGCLPRPP